MAKGSNGVSRKAIAWGCPVAPARGWGVQTGDVLSGAHASPLLALLPQKAASAKLWGFMEPSVCFFWICRDQPQGGPHPPQVSFLLSVLDVIDELAIG